MGSNWRDQQKQALRQQLYEAAIEGFRTHGFEATSVQQITTTVGVAKGTFFNHFPTKEHVVAAWYDGITVDCLAAAKARRTSSAAHAVRALFGDLARRAEADPALLIAKSRLGAHPLLIAAEKAQDETLDAYVHAECVAGKDRGEIAETVDVDFFVALLGDVLTGTSRTYVLTGMAFDFVEVIDARLAFLFAPARHGFPEEARK